MTVTHLSWGKSISQSYTQINSISLHYGHRTHTVIQTKHVQTGWSRHGIPVEVRFSMPVQTSPRPHTASCTKGTGSLSRGKAARAWQ